MEEDYKQSMIMDESDIIATYEELELLYIRSLKERRIVRSSVDVANGYLPCSKTYKCDICDSPARYGSITSVSPYKCWDHREKYDIIIEGICMCGSICTHGKKGNLIRSSCKQCKLPNHVRKEIHRCIECGEVANYSSVNANRRVYKCRLHSQYHWKKLISCVYCKCGKKANYGYTIGYPITCSKCKEDDYNIVVVNL